MDRVKPADWIAYKRKRLAEMGIPAAIGLIIRSIARAFYERRTGLVYSMTPDNLRAAQPSLAPGETYECHDNRIEDLLLWNGGSVVTGSAIEACSNSYASIRKAERTFHTIVVNGRLAGWGYSYWPNQPATLTETPGAVLEYEPHSVSLYDFHTTPEFRGRKLYQALLTHILRARFAEGAARAYITVLEENTASKKAIERVGFQCIARNRYTRLLTRRSLRSSKLPG